MEIRAPQANAGCMHNLRHTDPYVRAVSWPGSGALRFEVRLDDQPIFDEAFDVEGAEGVRELRDLCDAWLEYEEED